MNDYNFEAFLEDLNMGREIHFIYKKESYYIGRFMFWKFYDSASEIIGEDVEDLLQKVKLDGKLITEVWDLVNIDSIF